jgi:hypothetical protein
MRQRRDRVTPVSFPTDGRADMAGQDTPSVEWLRNAGAALGESEQEYEKVVGGPT